MSGRAPLVLVLGAGSSGIRHARHMKELGAQVSVADTDTERAASSGLTTVPVESLTTGDFDGVVVSTPTVQHHEHAMAALGSRAKVLVDKPLATSVDEGVELVALGGSRLSVAYNLRFHAPVQDLVSLVRSGSVGRPLSYRLWFGYWLPSWRPGIDYRKTYSAHSEMGGGVLLDAIHELDMALWLVGDQLQVHRSFMARIGSLDIDVEDAVRAVLTAPDGSPVCIELDYLSRNYRRGIEVIGDTATATLDWSSGTIVIADDDNARVIEARTPVESSYRLEAAAFVEHLRTGAPMPVDGGTALESLRLAEQIRLAST